VALPPLTPEQRAAALEKAAAARTGPRALKVRLKTSGTSLSDVLADGASDDVVGKMKVIAVLEAMPGVGKVKAQQIMDDLEISPSRGCAGSAPSSARRWSASSSDGAPPTCRRPSAG
jgi:hypothetical protein